MTLDAPSSRNGTANVALGGLNPGTTYYFRVEDGPAVGTAESSYVNFITWTQQRSWRSQFFGCVYRDHQPLKEDSADPDSMSELIEIARSMNPLVNLLQPDLLMVKGSSLEFTYRRHRSPNDGEVCQVEWSDVMSAERWSAQGVSERTIRHDGLYEQVQVSMPKGNSKQRYVRLRVSLP